MKCISVVFTIHEENGLANIPELCAILKRIRPVVIFLETPPGVLNQYLNGCTSNKFESASVRQYRASNRVEPVPVDLPTQEDCFFKDIEYLQERIKGMSPDFRRLLMWDKNYVHDYGFAYLNSERCSEIWSEIYTEMRAAIGTIKDQKLAEIFESWNKTNELRENEMLKNILKYCGENAFEKGVFLIGAAHRQSIIDKLKAFSGLNHVQWDFSSVAIQTNQKQ